MREYERPDLNTPEHWDQKWAGRPDYHKGRTRAPVVDWVLARLPPGSRVLDVGGGLSAFSCRADLEGHKPFVVDFSQVALDAIAEQGVPGKFCDVREWDGRLFGEFDAAVCLEFLEHLEEPGDALTLITAHTAHAFFSVPNPLRAEEDVAEHLRAYSAASLRSFLGRWFQDVKLSFHPVYLMAECRGLA